MPMSGPHFVNIAAHERFGAFRAVSLPCPNPEKAQHIHVVDLVHPPTGAQKIVIGGVDVVRQRQDAVPSCAAGVGNSLSTSVVWVCTASSANTTSCINRSTG